MAQRQVRAQLRLQRDLQELADRSWELPTVSALPLEDDMFEWHCNVLGTGELSDVVLHLKLLFPDTYPHKPPEVVLMSNVEHNSVFGDHLCLDMLEEGQYADAKERGAEFTGWSTVYSVFSILMQLQAFLFDLGTDAAKTARNAKKCACFCGHDGKHQIYPPLPAPEAPPQRPPQQNSPFDDDSGDESDASKASAENVKGVVTRVEPYGSFLRMPAGEIGLLRRADMPRGLRVERGERLACRIKPQEGDKLALTMMRQPEELEMCVRTGRALAAVVSGVRGFGAFVDLGGSSTLVHRSQMDLLPNQRVPWDVGDRLQIRLLRGPSAPTGIEASARALFLYPPRVRKLADGVADLARLSCFHSKEGFAETVLGLGVGLEAEEQPSHIRHCVGVGAPVAAVAGKGGGRGAVQVSATSQQRYHLTTVFDALAHSSFRDGVRRGVWKQRFREFLPLALDADHFSRAKRPLEEALARLSSGWVADKTASHGKSRTEKHAEFEARVTVDEWRRRGAAALVQSVPKSMGRPDGAPFESVMVLEVIPKLMNSQVVLISTGQLWRCEKALEGYMALHHLLLHCLGAYPELRVEVERNLAAFADDPKARGKSKVHNIGEFICLLSVSDRHSWGSIGIQMLEEVFDRNVLWILKMFPELGELSDAASSSARLRNSFKACRVSLRLLMFQVAFLQLVKPAHQHSGDESACHAASCMLDRKDRCKGLPGAGEAEWLFARCVEILDVGDYGEFLERVGAAPMDDNQLCQWLRRSVISSIEKSYHTPAVFRSQVAKRAKSKQGDADAIQDPEDFGFDTRPKESKAEKRARRAGLSAMRANTEQKSSDLRDAIFLARFYPYRATWQRGLFLECDAAVRLFDSASSTGVLGHSFQDPDSPGARCCQQAPRGWRILENAPDPRNSQKKHYPTTVWVGKGCTDCDAAVVCEPSGRCYPCCVKMAKNPVENPVWGLDGKAATARFTTLAARAINPAEFELRFTMFAARAINPVEFELHLDVGFDGLLADLKPLRAAMGENCIVGTEMFGDVFTRVERLGQRLWQRAPEQTIARGCRLVAGFMGITAPLYSCKVRKSNFVLLTEVMQPIAGLEDLERLRLHRTYCPDHRPLDPKTCKPAPIDPLASAKEQSDAWYTVCKNCRGKLRLRFAAVDRFEPRRKQMQGLKAYQLALRAALNGFELDTKDVQVTIKKILMAEGIIR